MKSEHNFYSSLESVRKAMDRPLSENERFWLEVVRLASWDRDPAPTLERVQKLRLIFSE